MCNSVWNKHTLPEYGIDSPPPRTEDRDNPYRSDPYLKTHPFLVDNFPLPRSTEYYVGNIAVNDAFELNTEHEEELSVNNVTLRPGLVGHNQHVKKWQL